MDAAEDFVRWALDDARTLEERYTTELIVEQGVNWWRGSRGLSTDGWEARSERNRQRLLNPAYEPRYTEEALRQTAEKFSMFKTWSAYGGLDNRPIRDITVLQFLPYLEDLRLNSVEVTDLTPLARIPRLRSLHFGSLVCEDFSPLADCKNLKELRLGLHRHWPNVAGLERLTELQTLALTGNLLAFERGVSWPKVRVGTLKCEPLAARSVRDLPQFPACLELTLGGVERLDGIEAFPNVRNLTIESDVRDFEPLEALKELTCFTCKAFAPLDLVPLTRLPKLYFTSFDTRFKVNLRPQKPRDFSTLIEAPQLREVLVEGCPPVKTEVAALNAGLPSWDDLFLLSKPRELSDLRIIVAPQQKIPQRAVPHFAPEESDFYDSGLRQCEERWVQRYARRTLNKRLGCSDWGEVTTYGQARSIMVTVTSFSMVEKLPKVLEATRAVLARLRPDYEATIMISLKSPQREPTPAELELERKFHEEQENADFEQRMREKEEYLERLHRFELKKQEGQPIKPEEFAPGTKKPLPPAPWEVESDEESDDPQSGDIAVKKKPEPPPQFLDDEHPLADNYRLMAKLTLEEAWFADRDRGLVIYLLGRDPDQVIPPDDQGQ